MEVIRVRSNLVTQARKADTLSIGVRGPMVAMPIQNTILHIQILVSNAPYTIRLKISSKVIYYMLKFNLVIYHT